MAHVSSPSRSDGEVARRVCAVTEGFFPGVNT
jgi:hypothetical protein